MKQVSHHSPQKAPSLVWSTWGGIQEPQAPAKPVQRVVAPAPKNPAAPQPLPKGAVIDQIIALWPGNDADAIKVIGCETGGTFNPRAVSRTHDYGLMQLNRRTWRDEFEGEWGFGAWEPNVFDVSKNLAAGWKIYSASGWRPWVCSRVL